MLLDCLVIRTLTLDLYWKRPGQDKKQQQRNTEHRTPLPIVLAPWSLVLMYIQLLLALAGTASLATAVAAAKDESKIVVFGSSVASGCCQDGGWSPVSYAKQMTYYQRDYQGRNVINLSISGGTLTLTLTLKLNP